MYQIFKHFDSKMFQILHFQKRSSDFSIFTFSEKHFDCIVAWLSCPSHCHHQIYNCCTTIELKKLFLKLTLMNTWNCQNVEWLFWWKLESHLFGIVIFQACRVITFFFQTVIFTFFSENNNDLFAKAPFDSKFEDNTINALTSGRIF